MKIEELEKIATENDYVKNGNKLQFIRKLDRTGFLSNSITIIPNKKDCVLLDIKYCDKKDIKTIKAAVKIAETALKNRGLKS